MSRRRKYLVFLGIIFLAFSLRFYQLSQNPPSLTWDEVAWGYNAYSLGIDGRDEYGRFLPLDYLESFGDFKPPLYAYLDILPVKIFGLNEFSTRLPSALFGVLTVAATYFLTRRLFPASKESLALLAALLLAISPWHINLSRAAFEANVATFFLIGGVWQFLSWVEKNKWQSLLFSAIAFALSIYTFNTARVVAPLLVAVLVLGFIKVVLARKKHVILAFFIGVLLMLPVARFLLTPQASLRFQEVNIFSDIKIINVTNQEIANDNNERFSKIIHNRRFAYTIEFLKHYFDHFKPSFLFIRGDGNPKFSTQDVGQLYLWELPFFIAGILFLVRRREGYWWIVPLWLLVGIAPAAIARETPHALRIETTLPTFQIIVAFGTIVFLSWAHALGKQRMKRSIITIVFSLLILNVFYYLYGYYVHYPREYSGEWQYGYRESITYLSKVQDTYDNIYITTELGRPHIYYLFYQKIDPKAYRKRAIIKRDVFGFVHVEQFDKYHFTKIMDTTKDNTKKKNLFINVKSDVPEHAKVVKTFYLLNGKPSLVAYTL